MTRFSEVGILGVVEPDHEASSDAELLLLIRAGDLDAMGLLYARHREAGLRVARAVTGDPHLAEDLVSTAFERIHHALANGHGPDDSFRAYLYTVIRRLAAEVGERRSREDDVDDWQPYEASTALADGTDGSVESQLVAKAFGALPERHQAVLWYLDVEGMTPAQAAPIFGLSPNAVSALAVRARDALRDAYVQAHVSDSPVRAECGPTRRLMGAYLRHNLSARDTAKVEAHLAECDECPAVLHELRDVSGGLRSVFGPILVGGAAVGLGAAAALGGGAQPASAAALGATTGGAGGAPSGGAGAAAPKPGNVGQKVAVGAAVVLAALAGATAVSAVAAGAAGGGSPAAATAAPTASDDYPQLPVPTRTPAPTGTPTPTVAPTHPATPTHPASPPPSAAPTATPTPTPSETAPVHAALDLDLVDDGDDGTGGGGRLGSVTVEVTNTDSVAIAVALDIVLPDGVAFDASRALDADAAWRCAEPEGSRQRCTASGVAPGAELRLAVPVTIAAEALGARPIANLSITRS